jgi:hypothetical protein
MPVMILPRVDGKSTKKVFINKKLTTNCHNWCVPMHNEHKKMVK